MVSLNITNIPTTLYHDLLEVRGKIHARTWVQVLEWAVREPEGETDIEFLSINGQPIFDDKGRTLQLHKIIFRTGSFVHEFDSAKNPAERFKLVKTLAPQQKSRFKEVGFNGKD